MEVLVYDSIIDPYYFELIPVLIWLSRPENEILKFHDFPGFPWPVRTLFKGDNNKCWLFSTAINYDFSHNFIK